MATVLLTSKRRQLSALHLATDFSKFWKIAKVFSCIFDQSLFLAERFQNDLLESE